METVETEYNRLVERGRNEISSSLDDAIVAAAERYPNSGNLIALLAKKELWAGELERANELVVRARELDGLDDTALAFCATVDAFQGQLDRALESFESILSRDLNHFETLRQVPALFLMVGRADEALAATRRFLAAYPTNAFAVSSVCAVAQAASEMDLRNLALELLQKHHPQHASTYIVLSRIATENQDLVAAESMARFAVASNNQSFVAWEQLAMVCRQVGKFGDAKQAAEYALSINKRSKVALDQLAYLARREGNLAQATEYERRSRDAVPFLAEMNEVRMAIRMNAAGSAKMAQAKLTDLSHSQNAWVNRLAKRILISTFREQNAPGQTEAILAEMERNRDFSGDWYAASVALAADAEQWERAQTLLQEGFAKHPGSSTLREIEAVLFVKRGDFDQVQARIDHLVQAPFGGPPNYVQFIKALSEAKQIEMAETVHRLLEREFPGSDAVSFSKVLILRAEGKQKEANALLDATLKKSGQPPISLGKMLALIPKLMWRILLVKLGFKKKK